MIVSTEIVVAANPIVVDEGLRCRFDALARHESVCFGSAIELMILAFETLVPQDMARFESEGADGLRRYGAAVLVLV